MFREILTDCFYYLLQKQCRKVTVGSPPSMSMMPQPHTVLRICNE